MSASRFRLLWGLARPSGLVWVALSPLVGYGVGHWSRAVPPVDPPGAATLVVAWALITAGTMWGNAAFDRDDGPVLYGEALPVPPGIWREAGLALGLGVAVAWTAGALPALCAAFCALLAVGYSHPAVGWKARPLAGPLVNVLGFGLASPLAGYALVRVPLDPRSALLLLTAALTVLGAYFVAQAFQQEEDTRRGYRTLVATAGPAAVLRAARLAFATSFALGLGLAAAGWIPRLCLIALPGCLHLDRRLAAWQAAPERGGERAARDMLDLALGVGLLFMAGATATWVYQVVHHLPLAGLGTAAGVPADAAPR